MPVEISTRADFSSRIPRQDLARVAARALRAEGVSADLTIYLTDNAEIRRLNRWFHSTNSATDVLSFPALASRAGESRAFPARTRSRRPYLGDIVISYERARAQAHSAGWRIADELALLVVHGVLHLVGYDDRTPHARARMWQRQQEILHREIPGMPVRVSHSRRSRGV